MSSPVPDLGWHVICGEDLIALLRRAHEGENPDLLYIEEYVNADVKHIEGSPQDGS